MGSAPTAPRLQMPQAKRAPESGEKKGTLKNGILASLLFAFLLVVVQILQVSGGDVGVGSGAEIEGIRVKIGEGKWRRSQRTLREEDNDKLQPKPHL
jgi:hypothetical protein